MQDLCMLLEKEKKRMRETETDFEWDEDPKRKFGLAFKQKFPMAGDR